MELQHVVYDNSSDPDALQLTPSGFCVPGKMWVLGTAYRETVHLTVRGCQT